MKEFHNIERILSHTRKATEEYSMIEKGDVIAVGVSGGKDSLALLCALVKLKRVLNIDYKVIAITIDMGLPDMDFSEISELCKELEVEYHIIKTQIYEIIFNVREEKSPCSLCSRMRRGALHDACKEFGCNKLALGHHYDDVVETFMLNLFFEGRIGAFRPVTYLSRKDLTMIRPLIPSGLLAADGDAAVGQAHGFGMPGYPFRNIRSRLPGKILDLFPGQSLRSRLTCQFRQMGFHPGTLAFQKGFRLFLRHPPGAPEDHVSRRGDLDGYRFPVRTDQGMGDHIRIPLQWSISCWMIWAVQPVKVFSRVCICSVWYWTLIFRNRFVGRGPPSRDRQPS